MATIRLYSAVLDDLVMGRLDDYSWRLAVELMLAACDYGKFGFLPPLTEIFRTVYNESRIEPGGLWEKRERFDTGLSRLETQGIIRKIAGVYHIDYPYRMARYHYARDNAWITSSEASDILARDCAGCRYCGRPMQHLDHVIPRKQGGANTVENLVCACQVCNLRKSGRTPDEAGMVLLPPPDLYLIAQAELAQYGGQQL